MSKITDVSLQKKDKKRFNIFIDGKFAFGISLEKKFEKKLEVGQKLSDKQIAALIRLDQTDRLLNKAFRFLSYRPRSEKEIRGQLLKKSKLRDTEKSGLEKEQYQKSVDEVIKKLKRLKQIDDKEFSIWLVEQRTKFGKRGKRLIRSELFQKGIDKEIAEEVLDKQTFGGDIDLAKKAAEKKLVNYKRLPEREFRVKMGQYLARRGFDWEIIKKTVDTFVDNRVE